LGAEGQSELFRMIVEFLPFPLYVLDASNYTIRFANSATRKGRSIANQTACYALFHKRDRPCEWGEQPCPAERVRRTKQPR